ncbi:MAG: DUF433 domain-containing protein [Saprospiraceae bacterium]|jgi:uncharacterized protein (DUF433 family)
MKNWQDHISMNSEIRFGKPCIKGTRISVYDILGWLASGMSHEEIIEDFPSLKNDDILAALSFSANRGENTKVIINAA